MKRFIGVLSFLVLLTGFAASVPGDEARTMVFEPVRAPSRGPDNAPVTIIEIADFM